MTSTRKRILRKIKLSEISAVDRPCQEDARAVIMKRTDLSPFAGAKPASGSAGDNVHNEGDHFMKDEPNRVAELEGQVTDLETQITELAKSLKGGTADPEILKAAELMGQVSELTAITTDLADALEKAKDDLAKATTRDDTLAEFSDEDRAYFFGLAKAEDKEAFLALAEKEREKKRKNREKDDEVVKLEGREIRKSAVGEDTFEILKAQSARIEKADADIRKERDLREMAELSKRADDEFSHVPGDSSLKAKMLKVVSAIADDDIRKGFETVLTTAEKLSKAGFSRLGHGGGSKDQGDSDLAKQARRFESEVEKVRVEHKIPHTEAIRKVRQAEPELFKAYQELDAAN